MPAPLIIESSSGLHGANVSIVPTGGGLSGFSAATTGDPAMDAVVAAMETRKKVVMGTVGGGAGLLLAGGLLSALKPVKWPALVLGGLSTAYGIWLHLNIDTEQVLPWEKAASK